MRYYKFILLIVILFTSCKGAWDEEWYELGADFILENYAKGGGDLCYQKTNNDYNEAFVIDSFGDIIQIFKDENYIAIKKFHTVPYPKSDTDSIEFWIIDKNIPPLKEFSYTRHEYYNFPNIKKFIGPLDSIKFYTYFLQRGIKPELKYTKTLPL